MTHDRYEPPIYVTTPMGAAALVGVGAGLTSLIFTFVFGQGSGALISGFLALFCLFLSWLEHLVHGRRR